MNRRRLITSIVMFVVIIGSMFTFDLVNDRAPVLGLDLRGGLSAIYAPTEPASQEDLLIMRDFMRAQLEDFGIAEPDIRVEGDNIIADLPGVNDRQAAIQAMDVAGIVELRPVIGCLTVPNNSDAAVTGTTVPGESTATTIGSGATATTEATTGTTATTVGEVTEQGLGVDEVGSVSGYAGFGRPATVPVDTTQTTVGTTETTTADQTGTATTIAATPVQAPTDQTILPYPGNGGAPDQQCAVGPPGGSGEVFERGSAQAGVDTQGGGFWLVTVNLRSEGEVLWNQMASQCYNRTDVCPSGQLAIVLDGVVQSAPTVQTPSFAGSVQITGNFSQDEAEDLARVLIRGAAPIDVEQQRTEAVSATAGQDSLNAAIIAGLVGIAIMLFTMVLYYRLLSVVMILGLSIWSVTVYVLATQISEATNYALTLAGATGIIISVGVTVDTYVVFFERIRDDRRAGRSFANAAPRSYRATGRTVLSADVVSLIASVILFSLSVGSVQGFALYLGITTVCDLLVFYFFTRPAVLLLSQTKWGRRSGSTVKKSAAGQSAVVEASA